MESKDSNIEKTLKKIKVSFVLIVTIYKRFWNITLPKNFRGLVMK